MLTRHQSQENLEVDSTIQPRGKGDPNKRSSQRHVNVPSVFRPRRFSFFLLFFFFFFMCRTLSSLMQQFGYELDVLLPLP